MDRSHFAIPILISSIVYDSDIAVLKFYEKDFV